MERILVSDRLLGVGNPTVFETSHLRNRPQARLFGLQEVMGDGWLRALKLEEYAPGGLGGSKTCRGTLFPYLDAL